MNETSQTGHDSLRVRFYDCNIFMNFEKRGCNWKDLCYNGNESEQNKFKMSLRRGKEQ